VAEAGAQAFTVQGAVNACFLSVHGSGEILRATR
jgi:hypothetical protein